MVRKAVVLPIIWIYGIIVNCQQILADNLCPDDWKQLKDVDTGGSVCLKIFKKPRTWDEAQAICNSEFGQLLTLNDNFYHKLNIRDIGDVVQQEIYNVFHHSGIETIWTSLRINGRKLWWMEILPEPIQRGSISVLWSWEGGQPAINTGLCGQATLQSRAHSRSKLEVSLHNCDAPLPFICISSGYSLEPRPVPHCKPGWLGTFYSDKCYKYTVEKISYSAAKQACVNEEAHLASPNTVVSFGLVRAVVNETNSGIECLQFTEVLSEDDTSNTTPSITCTPGQICQTRVKFEPDKISYTKNCEDTDVCSSSLEMNQALCHSGDLVFQAGFTELQCYDCCNSSDCTKSVKDRHGPLAQTLMNFENGMSGPINKRQADHLIPQNLSLPKYWIGLKKHKGSFSWESEDSFNANRSNFDALFEAQPTAGCVQVYGTHWEVIPCDEMLPYVCEMTAKIEALNFTAISSHKSLLSKRIQWEQNSEHGIDTCKENNASPHLCCNVHGNYHPNVSVVWVKDGVYISTGPAPAGLKLDLTKDLLYHLDSPHYGSIAYLQGFYHCEIWAQYPFQKVSSEPVQVTFKDIKTYRGILYISNQLHNNISSIQGELLQWGAVPNVVKEYKWMIETLMKMTLLSKVLTPDVDIMNIREGSLIIDFSVDYHLDSFQRKDWLEIKDTLNINLLRSPSTYAYHGDNADRMLNWIANELDEKFLDYIHGEVLAKVQDRASEWNKFYKQYQVIEQDVTITSTVACPSIVMHKNGEMFKFMRSSFGETTSSDEVCLSDGHPLAMMRCEGNYYTGGLWVDFETYDSCIQPSFSKKTQQLKTLSQREVNINTAEDISHKMVELTKDQHELNHGDVVYASKVLRNVATSPKNTLQIGLHIVHTVDNLVSVAKDILKKAQKVDLAASRLLEGLEMYSMTALLENNIFQRIVQPKLVLEIWQFENITEPVVGFGAKSSTDSSSTQNDSLVTWTNDQRTEFIARGDVASDVDAAVIFSEEVFNKVRERNVHSRESDPDDPFSFLMEQQPVRVQFTIYQDPGLFVSPSELEEKEVQIIANSKVVSGTVLGIAVNNLSQPVTTVFNPFESVNASNQYCAFWDFTAAAGRGNWSTEGCWLEAMVDDRMICHCNHLTNFAIIMEVERREVSPSHHLALSVISVVGAILSVVGLTLTVLTYILFRKLRKGISQKTLVNLATALLCTNVVFLCGIDRTEHYTGCAAISAILQYFLLASFSWMLVEGVLYYLKFVKVLDTYVRHFMIKAAVCAWGGPAVIVILVACVDWRLFRGHHKYCWLAQSAFYYSFLLPVSCVLVVNTVLFILVVKGMTCDRPKGLKSTQSDRELVALQAKAALGCFILLGLTWIFGFLAVRDARLVFQYIFCILNSFHGFWIFLNYCLREPSVRTHWREFICCKYITARKYSHTVSSGVFSNSGGHSSNKTVAKIAKSHDSPELALYNNHVPTSETPKPDSGATSITLDSSSGDDQQNSETYCDNVPNSQRLNEPVYENWNNFFLEQPSAVAVNYNTGVPYHSSLPRNQNGFGLEGFYNNTYQNLEFNSSDV